MARVLEFQLQHQSFNEHPGLVSFRMDWLDLLAVQGTLKSLLQHHSSKASILRHSAFFTVQLSHPYMTTGKTIALTRQTFVGKVMSLLLNMLSNVIPIKLPVFHRTRINNPKIYMKPQKTQNCQSKPKGKEHSWRHNPPRLQIIL